jgi:hypothetical protein
MDVHINRAWELLKFYFIFSNFKVSKEALSELLFVENENDERLLGRPVKWGEDKKKKRTAIQEKLIEEDLLYEENNIDWSEIQPHLQKIQNEIKWVREEIEKKTPAPEGCPLWEYSCAVVSVSLKKDNWYENEQVTSRRSPLRKILWVITYLRMWYRLWWRQDSIFCEKNPDIPIWGTVAENFTLQGKRLFVVPNNELRPVREWGPANLVRALEELMMGRLIGACNMNNMASVSLFKDYRAALLDLSALSVCLPVEGTPKTIDPLNDRFFRESHDRSTLELNQTHTDDATISLSKKIKEFQTTELQLRRKKMELEDRSGQITQKPRGLRWAEARKEAKENEVREWSIRLSQKKAHLRILKEDPSPLEEDVEIMTQLEIDIKDIENRLKDEENNAILMQQKEMTERMQRAKEMANKNMLQTAQSECRDIFVEKLSILVDHVYFWQFSSGGKQLNLYTKRHLFMKQAFFEDVVKTLEWVNELNFLENCHQGVVEFDINFPERESYRMDYPMSRFTLLDVCGSRRSKEKLVLEDFPKNDLTELLKNPKNQWYLRSWIYIVRYYLRQKNQMIPIDSTMFMIDLEEECCSLTRAELRNPVIGKVGYEWICLPGKEYFTPLDHLKGVWCGENLLDAIVCWCEMMGLQDWKIYDRVNHKEYNLEDSELYKFYAQQHNLFLDNCLGESGGGTDFQTDE